MICCSEITIATTTSVLSTKKAPMSRGTARRSRAFRSPSVFMTRYRLPCIASIATVVSPTSSGNGLSMSISEIEMSPWALMGTPERMSPNATPSRNASPAEAAANTASQIDRQRGDGSLLRNSIATVRRIITNRTSMNAR